MPAARLITATLLCLGLVGCGNQEEAAQAPVDKTVAGDVGETMERARSVEDTSMQHKEELDRALDSAESNH